MTKIQLRRDTAENFKTINPPLLQGEPCFETDTNKLKIGNGTTAYNDLPYISGSSEIPQATAEVLGGIKLGSGLEYDTATGLTNVNLDELGNEVNALANRVGTNETNIATNTTALSGTSIRRVTSEEYNALTTKDANTIYVVSDGAPVPDYLLADASNLDATGKGTLTTLGFPSGRYTDLTLGPQAGQEYTMPDYGYLYIHIYNITIVGFVAFNNLTKKIYLEQRATKTNSAINILMPVAKNDVVNVRFDLTGTVIFKFIYPQGAQ